MPTAMPQDIFGRSIPAFFYQNAGTVTLALNADTPTNTPVSTVLLASEPVLASSPVLFLVIPTVWVRVVVDTLTAAYANAASMNNELVIPAATVMPIPVLWPRAKLWARALNSADQGSIFIVPTVDR